MDEHFTVHGPEHEKRIYSRRASLQRMNSRLNEQLGLNGVTGIRNIAVHILL